MHQRSAILTLLLSGKATSGFSPAPATPAGMGLLLSNDGTRTRRDDRVRQAARELGWRSLPMSRTAMHAETTVSTPIAPQAATGPGDNYANNA
jgi:hypothetical protein